MNKQYVLFGFNPSMYYRDIGDNEVEICELERATVFVLTDGETIEELAERIVNQYVDQQPVVINAMLVEVKDRIVRKVEVMDKRPKRDWTHLKDYL